MRRRREMGGRDYSIVSLSPEHIRGMAEIERLCFSTPWTEEMLAGELTNPHAVYAVALNHVRVLGYAGMHAVVDEGYITNVAVHPDARRQGIGNALVQTLVGYGRDTGLAFLTLEARAGNREAITLYTSCGFEEVGRRSGYYEEPKEDAVLMTLWLKERHA